MTVTTWALPCSGTPTASEHTDDGTRVAILCPAMWSEQKHSFYAALQFGPGRDTTVTPSTNAKYKNIKCDYSSIALHRLLSTSVPAPPKQLATATLVHRTTVTANSFSYDSAPDLQIQRGKHLTVCDSTPLSFSPTLVPGHAQLFTGCVQKSTPRDAEDTASKSHCRSKAAINST